MAVQRALSHRSAQAPGHQAPQARSHFVIATLSSNKKGLRNCATLSYLVGRAGLEPATNGLKVRCSTN
jgi:hypothetical protein